MSRHYLALVIVFFLWGSLYVASKMAMVGIPPSTLLVVRFALAVPILGVMARRRGFVRMTRQQILLLVAAGLLGYFGAIQFQLFSTKLLDASLASLVNSTNPIFISLFAVLLAGERMTSRKALGLAISLVGVALVLGVGVGEVDLVGLMFAAGSVLTWSMTSVLFRKIALLGEVPSEQVACGAMAIALPFCLVTSAFELQTATVSLNLEIVLATLYVGVCCTALANFLWARCLQHVDASVCSLFYPLQPVFATLLGVLMLGEELTWGFVAGGALVAVGVLIGVGGGKVPKE